MSVAVINRSFACELPKRLENVLPFSLVAEIKAMKCNERGITIEEIRMRRGTAASLSTNRGTVKLFSVMTQKEMNETLAAMSGFSLYAHSETINQGYITLDGGIRVGICGRASVVGGRVAGVYDVSALNIRLPTHIKSVGEPICKLIRAMRERKGVLIYSPPGVGKTTLLRSVAYKMASGISPWRVSIIDTRGELALSFDGSGATVDLLTGYPKSVGIEIAARTMNPELMVCDEIGDAEEARAIIGAQNCGVPLLASAHGAELGGLLRRTGIRELHIAGVFGAYVGIERVKNESEYRYKINTAREADRYL